MCRWLVVLSWFLGVCSSVAAAPAQIHLQSHRTQHPEYQWLQRFLRMRGYHLVQRRGAGQLLSLTIQTPRIVLLRQGRFGRKYRLPAQMDSPVVRARMYMMCMDLFLDALRHHSTSALRTDAAPTDVSLSSTTRPDVRHSQQDASPRPRHLRPRSKRRSPVSVRLRLLTTLTVKQAMPRKHRSYAPQRAPAARREERISLRQPVPKKAVPPSSRRWIVLDRSQVPSAPQISPTRWIILDQSKHPSTKRLARPSRKPEATRVALLPRNDANATASLRTVQSLVPPRRVWGDLLSLDVGLAGGFRWGSTDHLFWGGRLLLGLNIGRFGIHAELSIHSDYVHHQQAHIPLVTPSLMIGWWVPLGAAERWLALSIRMGIETEAFVQELTYTEVSKVPTDVEPKSQTVVSTPLQIGIAAGLQLHVHVSKRWSLFVRPMVVVYPSGLRLSVEPHFKTSLSPVQISTIVGLQVRL